eukprot:1964679-Pyramimonas_sp.AAC.1
MAAADPALGGPFLPKLLSSLKQTGSTAAAMKLAHKAKAEAEVALHKAREAVNDAQQNESELIAKVQAKLPHFRPDGPALS